jgi:hypothetical protein
MHVQVWPRTESVYSDTSRQFGQMLIFVCRHHMSCTCPAWWLQRNLGQNLKTRTGATLGSEHKAAVSGWQRTRCGIALDNSAKVGVLDKLGLLAGHCAGVVRPVFWNGPGVCSPVGQRKISCGHGHCGPHGQRNAVRGRTYAQRSSCVLQLRLNVSAASNTSDDCRLIQARSAEQIRC